jgi:polyketide cyclase/dehydrase/lipid transport protein
MSNMIRAEESYVIAAAPDKIYSVLVDYPHGHLTILPPQFHDVVIEQGGHGAGTWLRGNVKVWGRVVPFHHVVSEPRPGEVLQERDPDTGQTTHFVLEPLDGGAHTRVTIRSDFPPSTGLMGFMERLTLPPVARDMYRTELRNLARRVEEKGGN